MSSPRILKKLNRVKTFTNLLRRNSSESCRSERDTPSPSPSARVQFLTEHVNQTRVEWTHIQDSVFNIYNSSKTALLDDCHTPMYEHYNLAQLHEDIHRLLRTEAGSFIFDFVQTRLLQNATKTLLELLLQMSNRTSEDAAIKDDQQFKPTFTISDLLKVWKYFYSHILPNIEAIFTEVQTVDLSIRVAALVSFRDVIILQIKQGLKVYLSNLFDIEQEYLLPLRHMFLVLQSAVECYPPSEKRLDLEELVAMIVSPYLGYRGLYFHFNTTPVIESNELSVAQSRRMSIVDPRRLSRPLSLNSNRPVETLNDLFVMSASRRFRRNDSRENMRQVRYLKTSLSVDR